MIVTDPGTITMIQGVGLSVRQPGLFQCCCCTLSIVTDYLMLTNAINSFQETKPFRMEQTGHGTFLKSLFADQVMGSS